MTESKIAKLTKLLNIMARLRDKKNGCPWDLEQTIDTIIPHTIEEVYEVVDAIEKKDMQLLKEELGDLLLQVVFLAQITSEDGHFDFFDVMEGISTKLTNRHPHIFTNNTHASPIKTAKDQELAWEKIKQQEKEKQSDNTKHTSILDEIANSYPALLLALKLQKKAAKTGFDWQKTTDILVKLDEEITEFKEAITTDEPDKLHIEEEFGDILFCIVNIARHLNINPEEALRKCNNKFKKRFHYIETTAQQQQQDINLLSIDEMENLWQKAKKL